MILYGEIKKNFPIMEKFFSKTELNNFFHTPYNHLYRYHFGFGTWIRNCLLPETSPLYELFRKNGIVQKDEMALFMIQLFYLDLHERTEKPQPNQ